MDQQAALFFETYSYLESEGYTGYEVSNFASEPRHQSQTQPKVLEPSVPIWVWVRRPTRFRIARVGGITSRLKQYLAAVDLRQSPHRRERDPRNLAALSRNHRTWITHTPEASILEALPGDNLGPAIWNRNQGMLDRWIESGLVEADSTNDSSDPSKGWPWRTLSPESSTSPLIDPFLDSRARPCLC